MRRGNADLPRIVRRFSLVRLNGKVSYINKAGKIVIPTRYILGDDFNGGLAFVVSDDDKGYFIDKTGKAVIELKK